MTPKENINNSFFDGYYKEMWRNLIPAALTRTEVDYLIDEGSLGTGSAVLDLMCGYGRHAIAFARQGVEVTAVDILDDYILEIKQVSASENLPVLAVRQNILEFVPPRKYDLVICMGNSVSFFDVNDIVLLFTLASSCLKKGHKFVFNTWMIAEIAIKHFTEKTWNYIASIKYLADSHFLFSPTRIETESIFIDSDGKSEIKRGIDYIYSLNEIEGMLVRAGFTVAAIWSIPGKKKFSLGEPRAYIVAEKI